MIPRTMRAIVIEAPHQVGFQTVPVPSIGKGEALIRTAYTGICATDFEIVEGRILRVQYPHIPGHEWSGTVAAVGSADDAALVGQRVVGENFITCGSCLACRQGKWNECPQSREVGFQLPGGYGEYFVTRASHLRVLPATVSFHAACLLEPTAVSVYAAERTGFRLGDGVVIVGDGPVGLILVQLALMKGASSVIVVGGREGRLALAKTLGAVATINYHREHDLVSAVRRLQAQTDVAIEASGSPRAFEAAFAILAPSGRLGVVGAYGGQTVTLDPSVIIHRNLTIVGSNASPGSWDAALALVASGRVQLEPLISGTYSLEEWEPALEAARSHRDDVIKVVLRVGSEEHE